jgi:hypothetical protein
MQSHESIISGLTIEDPLNPNASFMSTQTTDTVDTSFSEKKSLNRTSRSWQDFWSNFRKNRKQVLSMSQAEEDEERKIEHEIDNFVVPEELTHHRHHRSKSVASGMLCTYT